MYSIDSYIEAPLILFMLISKSFIFMYSFIISKSLSTTSIKKSSCSKSIKFSSQSDLHKSILEECDSEIINSNRLIMNLTSILVLIFKTSDEMIGILASFKKSAIILPSFFFLTKIQMSLNLYPLFKIS